MGVESGIDLPYVGERHSGNLRASVVYLHRTVHSVTSSVSTRTLLHSLEETLTRTLIDAITVMKPVSR